MQDRADPHARERAVDFARQNPPGGVSPDAVVAEVSGTCWTRSATPARSAPKPSGASLGALIWDGDIRQSVRAT